MKKALQFVLLSISISSCNSLYTVPSTPSLLLTKEEGTAINANLGSNGTTTNAALNITHPISDKVSINASISSSINGVKYESIDIYKQKNQTNFSINLGYNFQKLVNYPIQFWAGFQSGSSANSFATIDSITPYFKNYIDFTKGSYTAGNFAICNILISNYDHDLKAKNTLRSRFDIIESFLCKPIKYTFTENDHLAVQKNTILGYGITARLGINKFEFVLSDNFLIPGKEFFDEIFNGGYRGIGFNQFARSNPSFGITYYIGRKRVIN